MMLCCAKILLYSKWDNQDTPHVTLNSPHLVILPFSVWTTNVTIVQAVINAGIHDILQAYMGLEICMHQVNNRVIMM